MAYMDSFSEDEIFEMTDFVAPTTDLLRTEVDDFIFGPATKLKFKILEEESGVNATYFKVGSLPYMKTNGNQMMPYGLTDGEYTIKYYSVDNSGNQEQVRIDKIYLDHKGPEISTNFSISPNTYKNGIPVFSNEVKMEVKAEDEKVGMQKLTYQINNGPIIEGSAIGKIDFAGIEGDVEIQICAYDTFFNRSKEIIALKLTK